MNIIDSSGWLEYFADGPNASFFSRPLQKTADLTSSISILAAKMSIDHHLPMADSIILATAHVYKATIWTQDSDFKDIDGVKYITKNG